MADCEIHVLPDNPGVLVCLCQDDPAPTCSACGHQASAHVTMRLRSQRVDRDSVTGIGLCPVDCPVYSQQAVAGCFDCGTSSKVLQLMQDKVDEVLGTQDGGTNDN